MSKYSKPQNLVLIGVKNNEEETEVFGEKPFHDLLSRNWSISE